MLQVINNHDLDNSLYVILMNSYRDGDFSMLCRVLLFSGLRFSEANERSRWSFIGESWCQCRLAKRSGVRTFLCSEFPHQFITWLKSNDDRLKIMSQSTFDRRFFEHSGFRKFFHNSKPLTSHLFRYNFLKKMYDERFFNVEEIKEIIKHSTTDHTLSYINAIIMFEE